MSEKKTAIAAGESQYERYVVIGARWYGPFLARFVIVLGDADSLRERIAGISFVGIGFGRCEWAAAVIPNRPAGGDDPKNNQEKVVVDCEGDPGGAQSQKHGLRHRIGLSEIRRVAGSTLQYAIAASVLMFYSKNLLGAALRTLVGS